jgi:hypothetical protein
VAYVRNACANVCRVESMKLARVHETGGRPRDSTASPFPSFIPDYTVTLSLSLPPIPSHPIPHPRGPTHYNPTTRLWTFRASADFRAGGPPLASPALLFSHPGYTVSGFFHELASPMNAMARNCASSPELQVPGDDRMSLKGV